MSPPVQLGVVIQTMDKKPQNAWFWLPWLRMIVGLLTCLDLLALTPTRAAHWSFQVPLSPPLPVLESETACRTPIDRFIQKRLEQENLRAAPKADSYTLIRRVSLDLTGLPPRLEDVDQFVNHSAPDAYERLVDRLLASPQFGEHWALWWLDAARYADSNGYEVDRARSIWPYRDWVVRALNQNMPFDQFTIEQIAGDMLPNPTIAQQVATGFHRNTFVNEEGGHDWEEFRFASVVDRVHTTSTVWLGLTLACAQCHDHKYDPISQRDYFAFFGLLNNADEPELEVPDREVLARQAEIDVQIERLVADRQHQFPLKEDTDGPLDSDKNFSVAEDDRRQIHLEIQFKKWCDKMAATAVDWHLLVPINATSENNATMTLLDDGSILVTGDRPELDTYRVQYQTPVGEITGFRLEAIPDSRLPHYGPGRGSVMSDGTFAVTEFSVQASRPEDIKDHTHLKFTNAWASYHVDERTADKAIDSNRFTSWHTENRAGQRHVATFETDQTYQVGNQTQLTVTILQNFVHQQTLGRFRLYITSNPSPWPTTTRSPRVDQLLRISPNDRTNKDRRFLMNYFLSVAPELEKLNKQINELRANRPRLPTTFVMKERAAPRKTHLHERGDYRRPSDEITANVPDILHPLDPHQPRNRLTLARWLVDDRNPLVARVITNHFWQQYFGRGLITTPEDFGTRGKAPSHPRLLDHLAVEFHRQNWNMKAIHRAIVMSSVYRQSSAVTAEELTRDPDNVLLSRASRHRLRAETIRDVVLETSGLLDQRMGGPSVFPAQPPAAGGGFGQYRWKTSEGSDRYRRGLYTFRKRTVPYVVFSTFDTPPLNTCVVHRNRSNTPLQALAMLNDEVTIDAARHLARNLLETEIDSDNARMQLAVRTCLTRLGDETEIRELLLFYRRQQNRLAAGELDAAKVTGTNIPPAESTLQDFAAWTITSRLLLNLDELLVHE